ncbi:MAG: MMPL family transporter [Desulfobacteraceae bacterium]|jgi:predicted RND superfamily exporter protein
MQYLEKHIGQWVVKYKWVTLILTILIAVTAFSGIRKLKIDDNHRAFFSENDPALQAWEKMENTYVREDSVIIALSPRKGDVFTQKTLTALFELTEKCWQIPFSSRVDSIINFQHTYVDGDDLIVQDLVTDVENLTDERVRQIKEIALNEVMLVRYLISENGDTAGINVSITKPQDGDSSTTATTAKFVNDMLADFRTKYPQLEIHAAGTIMVESDFAESTKDDMVTLVPVMLALLFIVLGVVLRSIAGIFMNIIIIICSATSAIGIAGWLGIMFSPSVAPAPIIILTLAVADCVHILWTVFQKMREGLSKKEAICESLRINFQPVVITSLTTAIGFLAMNFSEAPPYHSLGNIIAIGMIMALFYSVTLLPAMVAILPIKVKPAKRKDSQSCSRLADFIVEKKNLLLWTTALFAMMITFGISQIELEDTFSEYLDQRYAYRKAYDFMQAKHLTGQYVVSYSLESGEPGGINGPEYLAKVDEFVNWARSQHKVVHVHSISNIIKQLNQNMHGDSSTFYKVPKDRQLVAQYMLLYTMSLPFGLDLNNMINVDNSATRVTVRLDDPTSRELVHFNQLAENWLKNNAPEAMHAHGAGANIILSHISERNIRSMLGSSLGALVIISILLMFALRSIKLGLISILPNLLPAIMAIGAWGVLVGEVGLPVSVLMAVSIGIVVDDTVHFLSKYRRARHELALSPADSVKYSFHTVGMAIIATTIALSIGFIVLSFSGCKINATMGTLTAMTLAFAIIMDVFLLPTFLLKVEVETK